MERIKRQTKIHSGKKIIYSEYTSDLISGMRVGLGAGFRLINTSFNVHVISHLHDSIECTIFVLYFQRGHVYVENTTIAVNVEISYKVRSQKLGIRS